MNALHTIGIIIVFLVGVEHLIIFGLENFASPEKQAKLFNMSPKYTRQAAARISMANQGIYNFMLGILIILAYFVFKGEDLTRVWQMLMSFVIVVGAFGGYTATKKIWGMQMLPALIALVLISFF